MKCRWLVFAWIIHTNVVYCLALDSIPAFVLLFLLSIRNSCGTLNIEKSLLSILWPERSVIYELSSMGWWNRILLWMFGLHDGRAIFMRNLVHYHMWLLTFLNWTGFWIRLFIWSRFAKIDGYTIRILQALYSFALVDLGWRNLWILFVERWSYFSCWMMR